MIWKCHVRWLVLCSFAHWLFYLFLNPVNCAIMCLANVRAGNGRLDSVTENTAIYQEHLELQHISLQQAVHRWMRCCVIGPQATSLSPHGPLREPAETCEGKWQAALDQQCKWEQVCLISWGNFLGLVFTESYNVRAGRDLGDHPVLPPPSADVGIET